MSAQVSADGQLEMRQLEMRTVRNEYWVCGFDQRCHILSKDVFFLGILI